MSFFSFPKTKKYDDAIKTTSFKIDGTDNFLHIKDAKYEVYGKYIQADGAEYPANSNINLSKKDKKWSTSG